MPRRPKNISIHNIPNEVLICEILGRVAALSFTDMFNLKLSCKTLYEIAEDKYVYQRVSLKKFPIIPWKPNEKHEVFINKCRASQNPEVMYRQAVVDYFNKKDVRSAMIHLVGAVKLGHVGALYVTCIVLMLSGEDDSRNIGITMLSDFRKSKTMRLKSCRKKLIKILSEMWVRNPNLIEPQKCCSTPNEHRWTKEWCEEDQCSNCEACNADREIKYIARTYNCY